MRHPLHVALSVSLPLPLPVPVPAEPVASRVRRHRKPSAVASAVVSVAPARRLAAGLGLASVLAATVLTMTVDPAAPVPPDRAPARQSSTFAQVSGH